MHSSICIERIKPIPRFKKEAKTWKDQAKKIGRQFAKRGSTPNIKAFIEIIQNESEVS
ncbi:MAG: hypothetical protein WC346_17330 [Methanogenium sp.]|jgi:hypothetical protein